MEPSEPALPRPTPETAHFWEGTRRGELRLQRCEGCARAYFPPQPHCPRCGSSAVRVIVASGRARLHSYVISYLPAPGFQPPYAIAVVELEEGPRMLSNLVDVPATPEALVLDMPLEVVFRARGEQIALPLFRPAGSPP
jgi:uncharacterized OB-fold protein